MTKLKIFTAFSGYDSQMVALKNRLGLDCDLVGWSEIDKYAIEAHDLLFPEYSKRNFGDICKIKWDRVPDFDLFTYSSPCQDFSTAGKMAGGEKGSGTRSSLLWECERAIKAKKPKYLLFENVAAVISSKSIDTFKKWCKKLENLGYSNYYQVLNALDYGVPQRRLRLYMVSIRDGKKYQFPAKIKLNKNLEDIIDSKVDSKYFIKTEGIRSRIESSLKREEKKWGASYRLLTPKDKANCILTKYAGSNDNYLISPTRDHHTGSILSYHKSAHFHTVCTSQTTSTAQWLKYAGQIRRLTPTECFRLMGLNDKEISKLVNSGISDTQLYKLAGNSIVVDVLAAIFGNLFKTKGKQQLGDLGIASSDIDILNSHRYIAQCRKLAGDKCRCVVRKRNKYYDVWIYYKNTLLFKALGETFLLDDIYLDLFKKQGKLTEKKNYKDDSEEMIFSLIRSKERLSEGIRKLSLSNRILKENIRKSKQVHL